VQCVIDRCKQSAGRERPHQHYRQGKNESDKRPSDFAIAWVENRVCGYCLMKGGASGGPEDEENAQEDIFRSYRKRACGSRFSGVNLHHHNSSEGDDILRRLRVLIAVIIAGC